MAIDATPPEPKGLSFDDYQRVVASWVDEQGRNRPGDSFDDAVVRGLEADRLGRAALKKYFPMEYAAFVEQSAAEQGAFADVSAEVRAATNASATDIADDEPPSASTASTTPTASDIAADAPPSTGSRQTQTSTQDDSPYSPGARVISGASPGGGGGTYTYTGPGLVGTGGVLRDESGKTFYYDLEEDPQRFYNQYTPAERARYTQALYDRGFYAANAKPGRVRDDINAFTLWLESANYAGLSKERYLAELPRVETEPKVPGGRRVILTSPDDLKKIARRISQDTLGRELTDTELNSFVTSYQGLERQYQTGGATTPPDVTVSAETFAREVAPTEANAYEYLGYMNQLFGAVGVR